MKITNYSKKEIEEIVVAVVVAFIFGILIGAGIACTILSSESKTNEQKIFDACLIEAKRGSIDDIMKCGELLDEKENAMYKPPLDEIWETRKDLQCYFPDRRNGIGKMKGWTMKMWAEEFGWREYKILKKYNEEEEKDYIYEKYLPLEKSLTEISSRVYVRDGEDRYNCIDFSEDLQKMLKEEGIESITISGDTPNGRHRWIAIEFEPISGKFIDDNYEADFLREK